jgi:predicted small lipoprotein YifL
VKNIKWFYVVLLVFSLMGCSTTHGNLYTVLAQNPNVSPEDLKNLLHQAPVEDKQIDPSFRYQIYKTGLIESTTVYFKNGHMVSYGHVNNDMPSEYHPCKCNCYSQT